MATTLHPAPRESGITLSETLNEDNSQVGLSRKQSHGGGQEVKSAEAPRNMWERVSSSSIMQGEEILHALQQLVAAHPGWWPNLGRVPPAIGARPFLLQPTLQSQEGETVLPQSLFSPPQGRPPDPLRLEVGRGSGKAQATTKAVAGEQTKNPQKEKQKNTEDKRLESPFDATWKLKVDFASEEIAQLRAASAARGRRILILHVPGKLPVYKALLDFLRAHLPERFLALRALARGFFEMEFADETGATLSLKAQALRWNGQVVQLSRWHPRFSASSPKTSSYISRIV